MDNIKYCKIQQCYLFCESPSSVCFSCIVVYFTTAESRTLEGKSLCVRWTKCFQTIWIRSTCLKKRWRPSICNEMKVLDSLMWTFYTSFLLLRSNCDALHVFLHNVGDCTLINAVDFVTFTRMMDDYWMVFLIYFCSYWSLSRTRTHTPAHTHTYPHTHTYTHTHTLGNSLWIEIFVK